MGTMDTLARLSELLGIGKRTRAYAGDGEGSERRPLTGWQAKRLSLEALEPRVLLDAGLLPGQFTLVDGAGAGPDVTDVIGLADSSSANASVLVQVTDGPVDTDRHREPHGGHT